MTSQEIERGAHLLYVMSKTYHDISSEYMVNQIVGMNNLLYLSNDADRKAYLNSLSFNTTTSSKKIIQLAKSRHNEYTLRNKARQEEYEQFLAKLEAEELEMFIG